MKMLAKEILAILLFAVSITFQSCKTVKWTVRDTATLDVQKGGILTKPKVADLKIENFKVTGTAEGDIKEETMDELKGKALQDALKNGKADILVEPIYEMSRNGREIKAEVTGFPAKVLNFREIEPADTLAFGIASKYIIPSANLKSTSSSDNAAAQMLKAEKKKKLVKSLGLGLGLGVALPIILGTVIPLSIN